MARKSAKALASSRGTCAINPATGLPWRVRAPREMRIVSTTVRPGKKRKSKQTSPRRVPQIRLSGDWLERAGFTPGRRFLVLADVPHQILLAIADP